MDSEDEPSKVVKRILKFKRLISIKPWSLKFWLTSIIAVTILSCNLTLLIFVYVVISESLKPCGSFDSYLRRSNCLKVLQYSYYDSHISDVSFSPDGQLIAAGGLAGNPKIWNINSGEVLHQLDPKAGGLANNILFSPNGETIAIVQNYTSNTLTLLDPKTGSILVQLRDQSPINDITYSSDGTILAIALTTDTSNLIQLIQVSDGQFFRSFSIDSDTIIGKMTFSQNGEQLLAVVNSGTMQKIYTWNINDGTQIDEIMLPVTGNLAVAFSPTKKLVALGSCAKIEQITCSNAEVTLWQLTDGGLLQRFNVSGSYVNDIVFSADGIMLATSSTRDTQDHVQLWGVKDGTLLDTFGDQKDSFSTLAFSPDGTILAIGRTDITLWKIK